MAILAQLVDGVVVHKFELRGKRLSIGRLPHNDVVIDDSAVSSQHALVERSHNPDFPDIVEYFVKDLGSTNGTEVNGQAVVDKVQLHHNDEIKIAWNHFKFFDDDAVNLAKTTHILSDR